MNVVSAFLLVEAYICFFLIGCTGGGKGLWANHKSRTVTPCNQKVSQNFPIHSEKFISGKFLIESLIMPVGNFSTLDMMLEKFGARSYCSCCTLFSVQYVLYMLD